MGHLPGRWCGVLDVREDQRLVDLVLAYLRLIDSCITQLKAQGPSRTCNESKEEEEDLVLARTLEPLAALRLFKSAC